MANQILKKFIGDNQVDQNKILLDNDAALKAKDSTGLLEKDLIKLNNDDKVEISDLKDPVNNLDAATKKYVDDAVTGVAGDFVEDAGDTMFGSLVIDGSTAVLPQAANLQVKDHLDNSKAATLDAYSLSSNHEFQVSGATSLSLDAGGGVSEITMSGSTLTVNTPSIDLNGDVDVQNYLIRPDNTPGQPFFQFPSIGEKVFISGGSGDINLSTPTGKTVFGDSGSIIDCLYVDPTTNRLSKVSSVEGTALTPSYLTLDGMTNDASLVSPTADVNLNAISGEVNLNANAVDVNAPMYIDQNKIALDAISGYELRFDNTSPDAGTYLSSPNDIYISNGAGGYVYTASIKTQLSNIYNVTQVTANADNASNGSGTISLNTNSVTIDANLSMGTIDMNSKVDMNSNALDGLVAPVQNGQPLIYEQLGAANGVATLDANQKVPASQLPNSVMEYQGVWDASSNTPTLANGAGNADIDIGNVYRVNAAGTADFGAGNITFLVGDYVILNSSKIWERSHSADVDPTISAIEDDVSHLVTLSGMPVDSDDLGTFTGSTIGANKDVKEAFQALETALEEIDQNVDDLITLSGVAENSTDFGSFTGTTIGANKTAKQAFQALETAHENHLNDTVDAHDASAISLSPSINGQSDVQAAMGDHETRIDALEAITPEIFKKTLIAGDITNKYIDLPFLAVQTKEMSVFADRLALHQDLSWTVGDTSPNEDDYRLSVVSGATRIHFLNDLVGSGNQKLAVGDTIYVRYKRSV